MINNNRDFITLAVTLAALVVIGGSQTGYSQNVDSADSTAIMTRFNLFQEALRNRDTNSIGDYYAHDAVSILENQPVRRGRQLIAARWAKVLMGPFVFHILSPELNIARSGQDAFQFGMFEIHSTDTTHALLASGKVTFLWRKESDQWRITLEMDNFDRPSPPARKE
jgi:ketosteroid isomerase-like protein